MDPGALGSMPRGQDHVSSEPAARRVALPPEAVRAVERTRSMAKASRNGGQPPFGPVPERLCPPKGCTPTTAPIWLRFTYILPTFARAATKSAVALMRLCRARVRPEPVGF